MNEQYEYLLSLPSIRDGAKVVYQAALDGKLRNFDFHPDKMDEMISIVSSVILVWSNWICRAQTNPRSEISVQNSSQAYLLMEGGSISRLVTHRV